MALKYNINQATVGLPEHMRKGTGQVLVLSNIKKNLQRQFAQKVLIARALNKALFDEHKSFWF